MLTRLRLERQVLGVNDESLVVITAGPGFGKTTLLKQLESRCRGNSIFHSFQDSDRDLRNFILSLILAARRLQPGFGGSLEEKVYRGLLDSGEGAAESPFDFVQELHKKTLIPLTLFFDNLEMVNDSPETIAFVRHLLGHFPRGSRMYVAARSRPNLGIGRLRAAREVVEINQSHLKFTPEETAAFLRPAAGMRWTEKEIMAWHEAGGGWPAPLDIIRAELTERRNAFAEKVSELINRPDALNGYLTEIWNGLDAWRRNFFMECSLVEPVEPAICALAGIETGQGLFVNESELSGLITATDEPDATFSIQPLFREFLVYKLKQVHSRSEISKLHRNFARAYAGAGNVRKAVHHFIEAEDFDCAASLAEGLAAGLVEAESLETVENWLEKIPPGLQIKHPWLCLAQAHINFNRAEPAGSKDLVARAAHRFRAAENHKGLRYSALTANRMGTQARRMGAFCMALDLHEQSLACCRSSEKRLIEYAGILANIGADKFRISSGLGDAGENEIAAAFALARRHGYKYVECQCNFHWAWKAFHTGRKAQAGKHIKAALGLAAPLSHRRFIAGEGRINVELLAYAFECNVERDFLKNIFGLIGEEAMPLLARLLTGKPAAERAAAIAAFAAAAGPAAAETLRPFLRDKDSHVRSVARKELAEIHTAVVDPWQLLTRREKQILTKIASGLSNMEIAGKLSISEATVKRHVSNIFLKIGLNRRRQVIEYFKSHLQKQKGLVLNWE